MNRNFSDEIKYQWKHGGMQIKLIGVNLAVFVLINILLVFGSLMVSNGGSNPLESFVYNFFTLRGDFFGFLTHPWGIFTSIFAHFDFMHLAFNMLFLYFISKFFMMYFSNQRLLYTYILGGIMGGFFQIAAYSLFPALQGTQTFVVGASGSVNAIFMAAAFHRPMAIVHLFGRFKVKMIYLAGIFILMDLVQMGGADNVAHFAHLGGAAFGILSIRNINSKNNVVNFTRVTVENIKASFSGKPKMKAHKGGKSTTSSSTKTQKQTDSEYNLDKKKKQAEIDAILDKISKSGYDSLTKKEKQILFDQSQ
ncbi:rhomboid family intramembrane serine protease [Brumimicrobium glaciale]|uniref:Rhomboid family intramembrane serine protease n=1 Tax=Brumimicrobium glaciale TaxID=200475 RepID=A0A4Q4KLF4_9FLAO|nr:rhomboid family intramembrane serine protease [Brumimicrobium glaciale]RYM33567.1 rhomboid family intramembrane serine protease [Brumimicrobium glaciale]